jgi:hypothetical protein
MANKKNVQSMTPEELAAYVETVRQRNAANSKKYYEQKIKNDPEKYAKFLDKCRAPNRKYYHTKQIEAVIIKERLPSQAHASEPVCPKPYIKTACDLFTDSIHSP